MPSKEAAADCCFACGCVLELVVCWVRFARVSCPWLRFEEAGARRIPARATRARAKK